MKKILLSLIAIASLLFSIEAETYMRVRTDDGKVEKYDVETVRAVEYQDEVTPYPTDTTNIEAQGVSVSGIVGKHTYVDLGLPSGVMWATYNVEATDPSGKGNCYAWGETEKKISYTWQTYKWCTMVSSGKFIDQITKYNTNRSYGANVDNISVLEYKDDVAAAKWGKYWRMPTVEEQIELIQACDWEWIADFNNSGIGGSLGTSKKNGNTIFLPTTDLKGVSGSSTCGYYWSSSLFHDNTQKAYYMQINGTLDTIYTSNRLTGMAVRPVIKTTNGIITTFMRVNTTDGNTKKYNIDNVVDVYYKEMYTVNFYNYDSTLIESHRVIKGDSVQTPSNPSKQFAIFTGWDDSTFVNVQKDLDIYAQYFDLTVYTVNFYGRDSTLITSRRIAEGDDANEPEPPFVVDHMFTGWSASFTNVTSDLNIYAQYKILPLVTDSINGYGYVDLGLESGLVWATCNVGAAKPNDYGVYFAWGETTTKSSYNWKNYKWCKGADSTMTKYCMDSVFGDVDSCRVLYPEDDMVYVNWKGPWRMPSPEEYTELIEGCDWKWTTNFNGTHIAGSIGTSKKNGNIIFFPAAGYKTEKEYEKKENGRYWYNSLSNKYSNNAGFFSVGSTETKRMSHRRFVGTTVRGVIDIKSECTVNFFSADSTIIASKRVIKGTYVSTPDAPERVGFKHIGWSDSSFTNPQTDINTYAVYTYDQGVTVNGEVGKYTYVDLGLASGLKWATYNVGAILPNESGDYFAWGETEGKSDYSLSTYKWCTVDDEGKLLRITKYCSDSLYGEKDDKETLDPEDDAAYVNWGNAWRTPTHDEFIELVRNCKWTRSDDFNGSGVAGYIGTSRINNNTIFFPASGYYETDSISGSGECYYWQSSLREDYEIEDKFYAYCSIDLNTSGERRNFGLNIRAITTIYRDVKFHDYDSTLIESKTVVDGTGTSAPQDPNREGYIFIGWSDSSFTNVRSDMDIYAQYCKGYTINFHTADSVLIESQFVKEGSDVSTVGAPFVKDFRFTGWEGDSTLSNVQRDMDLYAHYVPLITTSGTVGEYEYVDLGLPSGLKWASYNVDATEPSGQGGFYAWAETYTKSKYNWGTYKYDASGGYMSISKYNRNDGKTTLESTDDAANVKWGGDWRMPTHEEQTELLEGCDWEWTNNFNGTGVRGRIGISKANGNVIFLPNCGYYDSYSQSSFALYWSSSIDGVKSSTDEKYAYYIRLNDEIITARYTEVRCCGGQIRAVTGNSCKVNFYSANNELLSSQLVKKGASATAPKAPQLTAYVFTGWSDSSFTNVQSNLDVYAQYEVPSSGKIAGYHYIDLGLPSGLKWASYNVGATNHTESGYYVAWGETTAKDEYDWGTYKHGTMSAITKYSTTDFNDNIKDDKTVLETEDDAATANWGSSWRMPTSEEMEELIAGCDWVWVTDVYGPGEYKSGILGTSKTNGNIIFLTNAGSRYSDMETYSGGHYWTSSLDTNSPCTDAKCLLFGDWLYDSDDYSPVIKEQGRDYGCSIRAVSE